MNKGNRGFAPVDSMIFQDIQDGYPGCVLSIIKNRCILKKTAYGCKFRYDKSGEVSGCPEKMDTDTVFDLASNSKIYATVFGIMKLVSDGLLNIDLPVKNYIPEYIYEKVTTRHLLTHSSGYGSEIWFFDDKNKHGKKFFSQNRETTINLILKEAPLEYETGTKSIYSDTGFMLLGILIEKISGLNQDKYLKEKIYKPLGLNKTTYNPLKNGILFKDIAATSLDNTCGGTMGYPNIRTEVIRGEVQDEKAFYSMDGIAGHAGLFSTVGEVIVLVEMILNKGIYNNIKILESEVVNNFAVPSEVDGSFGLGWRILSHESLKHIAGGYVSRNTIGHTGFTGTVTLIDIENNLAIILLTNKIHTKCLHRQDYMGNRYNIGKYHPVINEVYKCLGLVK